VSAIPLSIDLWLHYIAFRVDQCQQHEVLDAEQKTETYDCWFRKNLCFLLQIDT